jgi:YHS domain-containing protein
MMAKEELTAIDPVCGMTVDIEHATAAGLTAERGGRRYYFCGKGCKLEFEEDPARYLAPNDSPST